MDRGTDLLVDTPDRGVAHGVCVRDLGAMVRVRFDDGVDKLAPVEWIVADMFAPKDKHLHLLGFEPIRVNVLGEIGDSVTVQVVSDPNEPTIFPAGAHATVLSQLVH